MVLPWSGKPKDAIFLHAYEPVVIETRVEWLGNAIVPRELAPEFHGVLEAYRYFRMPVPQVLTVERCFEDFFVPDGGGLRLAADLSRVLERHSDAADSIFVDWALGQYEENGQLFEDKGRPNDVLRISGGRALVTDLQDRLADRFFSRRLDDPLYL